MSSAPGTEVCVELNVLRDETTAGICQWYIPWGRVLKPLPVVDLDVLAVGGAFGFFSVRFHWSPHANKTDVLVQFTQRVYEEGGHVLLLSMRGVADPAGETGYTTES